MKILVPAALVLALLGCGAARNTAPAAADNAATTVVTLTTPAFPALMAQAKPVLIDFWAPWCPPCRTQGPIVEQVSTLVGDRAIVAKVNVDNEKALASQFGIRSIPTLLLIKNGKVVQRFVGVQSAEALTGAIKSASL